MADLGMDTTINKLIKYSTRLSLKIEYMKGRCAKDISLIISHAKSDKNNPVVVKSASYLIMMRDISNGLFDNILSVLQNPNPDTYKTDLVLIENIKKELKPNGSFGLIKNDYIDSIRDDNKSSFKNPRPTHRVRNPVEDQIVADFKISAINVGGEIDKAIKLVEKFIIEKKIMSSLWEQYKSKDHSAVGTIKQKVKDFKDNKFGKGKKLQLGKLAFAGASSFIAAMMFSPALAAPSVWAMKKRNEINTKGREDYLKQINNIQKQKATTIKRIKELRENKRHTTIKQALNKYDRRGATFFAGGGSVRAKKNTSAILGDNPGGVESYAIKKPTGLLRGITHGITGINLDRGDKLKSTPLSGKGITKINSSSFAPSQFGAGTEETGTITHKSITIEEKQLAVLKKMYAESKSFYKKFERSNKSSGGKTTNTITNNTGVTKTGLSSILTGGTTGAGGKPEEKESFLGSLIQMEAGKYVGGKVLKYAKFALPALASGAGMLTGAGGTVGGLGGIGGVGVGASGLGAGALGIAGGVGAGAAAVTAGTVLAGSLAVKKVLDDNGFNAATEAAGKQRALKKYGSDKVNEDPAARRARLEQESATADLEENSMKDFYGTVKEDKKARTELQKKEEELQLKEEQAQNGFWGKLSSWKISSWFGGDGPKQVGVAGNSTAPKQVDKYGAVIPTSTSTGTPEAKTILKAMKATESGGNYKSSGGSGENGAYQFMPSTWSQWSSEMSGGTPLPMTPENQDAVAEFKVKQWLDRGLTKEQIFAKWNSNKETGWENHRGVNSQGIAYDTPRHVEKCVKAYNKLIQEQPVAQKVPTQALNMLTAHKAAMDASASSAPILGINPDGSVAVPKSILPQVPNINNVTTTNSRVTEGEQKIQLAKAEAQQRAVAAQNTSTTVIAPTTNNINNGGQQAAGAPTVTTSDNNNWMVANNIYMMR
jgi:hypothetical protein